MKSLFADTTRSCVFSPCPVVRDSSAACYNLPHTPPLNGDETMQSVNQFTATGNLTRDVQLKYTAGGMAIAEFGLAINNRVKKGNDWEDAPAFIDVTCFQKTAEIAAEQLAKGSPALICGRIVMDSWSDKATGQKRTKLKVNADTVQPLQRFAKSDSQGQPSRQPERETVPASGDDMDETPF